MALPHHRGNTAGGQGNSQELREGEHFAESQPADEGGNRRYRGEDQHGNAGTNEDKGLEQKEIADDEAHETRQGEPQPRVGSRVDRQGDSAEDEGVQGEQAEGDPQADQIHRERSNPFSGALEGERGDSPTHCRAQSGKLAEISHFCLRGPTVA